MSAFESSVLLIIEFLCGGAGGIALGRWLRGYSLGSAADVLIGGIGGLIMAWLAARIPSIGRFVGHVEAAADATMQGVGGLTPPILIGVGVVGLLGGIVLTALAGFVKAGIRRDVKPPRH